VNNIKKLAYIFNAYLILIFVFYFSFIYGPKITILTIVGFFLAILLQLSIFAFILPAMISGYLYGLEIIVPISIFFLIFNGTMLLLFFKKKSKIKTVDKKLLSKAKLQPCFNFMGLYLFRYIPPENILIIGMEIKKIRELLCASFISSLIISLITVGFGYSTYLAILNQKINLMLIFSCLFLIFLIIMNLIIIEKKK